MPMITPDDLCKNGTELGHQMGLMHWVAWQIGGGGVAIKLHLLHAIPNGGERSKVSAAKAKAEGVKRGVSDLFLPVACHGKHGLYIEMKNADGRPSKEQLAFGRAVQAEGYGFVVCYSWREAAQILVQYLGFEERAWEDGRFWLNT